MLRRRETVRSVLVTNKMIIINLVFPEKSEIDRMKGELTESFLAILKEKKENLYALEVDLEKINITYVADQMKKLAEIKRALQEAVPTYISMLKNVQEQRKKILLLLEKELLDESPSAFGKDSKVDDDSALEKKKSSEDARIEICNKFFNEVFDEFEKRFEFI
jgi:hypothetical protein